MQNKNPFDKNKIHNESCLDTMKRLPDNSIQCVVTSPPYWGLRDYGVEGQLGLEATPELYVAEMVKIFSEVRRVLKKDGTLWLNLGDTYSNTSTGGNGATGGRDKSTLQSSMPPIGTTPTRKGGHGYKDGRKNRDKRLSGNINVGLKSKNLVGIPWRVAFALQADGWYLRQDIIWHKPNPMPESVTDRCTKSHEYIFLLTKSAKYYYDNVAIKEPVSEVSLKRARYGWDCDRPSTKSKDGIHVKKMGNRFVNPDGRNKRDVWTVTTKPFKGAHFATFNPELIIPCISAGTKPGDVVYDPFMGSGTTAETSMKLGRKYLGSELNHEYAEIARDRLDGMLCFDD